MRIVSLSSFVLAFLLAACGSPSATPAPPTASLTPWAPQESAALPTPLCIDARQPTPVKEEASLFPAVSNTDHLRGQPEAAVTVVMYSDFQCSDCAIMAAVLEAIRLQYPAELRVVYRHFPLVMRYDKALLTIQASEAARLQGQFWELHDLLFAQQAAWSTLPPEAFKTWLMSQVAVLGLDTARYELDLNGEAVREAVTAAIQASQPYGQLPLPLLLINGEIVKNSYVLANLEQLIHLYALPARQFSACPPSVIDPSKTYIATLKTSRGAVTVKLFADKTPNTVNNFVFLARNGWYDRVPFHQVIPGYMAQTGDPSGTGMGNPGYFISDEILPGLKFDRAGMLAMFNVGAGTNGSQFFITLGPQPKLNGQYTIFGEVIDGLEALTSLPPRHAETGAALGEPELLLSVSIEEQ